jgi:hypothetical protein
MDVEVDGVKSCAVVDAGDVLELSHGIPELTSFRWGGTSRFLVAVEDVVPVAPMSPQKRVVVEHLGEPFSLTASEILAKP